MRAGAVTFVNDKNRGSGRGQSVSELTGCIEDKDIDFSGLGRTVSAPKASDVGFGRVGGIANVEIPLVKQGNRRNYYYRPTSGILREELRQTKVRKHGLSPARDHACDAT